MSNMFEERERAAEYGYTHDEELRFLALRDGVGTVARWAADAIGQPPKAAAAYADALIGRLVAGAGEADLVARVRQDLENAGHPGLAPEVGHRFAQAVAEASDRWHGRKPPRHEPALHSPAKPSPHTHGFWGWTV